MKQDALMAFNRQSEYDGGFKGLAPLLSGLDDASSRPLLHLVGHSAGAIVLGHLLSALGRFRLGKLELGTVHLMAPACTVDFFKEHYGPYLTGSGAMKLKDRIYLYNMTDALEQSDTVSANFPLVPSYSRSLLYLVSRAYELAPNTPIAGMQAHAAQMPSRSGLVIAYSNGTGGQTASRSHGGFDNDPDTLTTIMTRILGQPVPRPPKADELTGY
jgi:hypothetical protein